jgi:exodeoxyribonuclease III
LIRNHPDRLETMCREHDLDVLCLQETKLQETHLDDTKLQIRATVLQPDYDAYYSCSTAKKGYSGTAVFVKKRGGVKGKKQQATLDSFFGAKKGKKMSEEKKDDADTDVDDAAFTTNLVPTDVSYKMGVEAHDQEGRLVIADFPLFSIINCYVPNSGQKLERLDYRTEQWDKDLLNFVQTTKSDTPCIWLGDLNVAHTNLEVWNDGAKHLAKQAGVTVQERDSFQNQLDTSGFKDAFRALHPTARGCYSYWSQRAGNREPNKGLRLDYFICAPELFDDSKKVVARDSYALYDVFGSDHCPVVLELEIKK